MVASIAWATRDPSDDHTGETVATLAERSGSVQYRHEDFAIWDYVTQGHKFFGAEVVATGPESRAVVRFNDGRALELGAGAQVGLSLGAGAGAGGLVVTLLKGDVTVVAPTSAPKSTSLPVLRVRSGGRTVEVDATATVKMARKQGSEATTIEVVKGKADVAAVGERPAVALEAKPMVIEDAPKPAAVKENEPRRVATYFQAAKANADGSLTVQPAAAVKVERVTYVPSTEVPAAAPDVVAAQETTIENPPPAQPAPVAVQDAAPPVLAEAPPVKNRQPRARKTSPAPVIALATPALEPTPEPAVAEPIPPPIELPPPAVIEDEPALELALAITVEAEEEEDTGPSLAERLSVPGFSSGTRFGVPILSGPLAEKAHYASVYAAAAVGKRDRVRARADLWPEARDVVLDVPSKLSAQRLELGYGIGYRLSSVPVRLEAMPKLLSARVAATLPATAPDGRREPRSLDARFTGAGVGGTAELVWRRSLFTAEGGYVPPLKTLGLELSGAHFTAEWQYAFATWSNTGALALTLFVASESTKVEQGKEVDDGGLRKVEFKQVFAGGGLNLSL